MMVPSAAPWTPPTVPPISPPTTAAGTPTAVAPATAPVTPPATCEAARRSARVVSTPTERQKSVAWASRIADVLLVRSASTSDIQFACSNIASPNRTLLRGAMIGAVGVTATGRCSVSIWTGAT